MRPLLGEQNSFIDRIFGKYLIIQNVGTPSEVILYNSIKYFPQNGYTSDWVLMGKATNNVLSDGFLQIQMLIMERLF